MRSDLCLECPRGPRHAFHLAAIFFDIGRLVDLGLRCSTEDFGRVSDGLIHVVVVASERIIKPFTVMRWFIGCWIAVVTILNAELAYSLSTFVLRLIRSVFDLSSCHHHP